MTPEERSVQQAVRGLPPAAADPAFRERLRREFVSGSIPGSKRRGGGTLLRAAFRRSWFVPIAAAAILLGAVWFANRAPAPRVAWTNGTGKVLVNEIEIPAERTDEIAKLLHAGSRLRLSGGATIDLLYDRTMAWRLTDGTDFVLPAPPGRWFGRAVACEVALGEAEIRTGPGFAGARLTVRTGEGITRITGTLVSIERDESVTCVCVQEGTALVGIDEAGLEPVPHGKRKVLFRDGSEPVILDIAPPHRDHLLEFEEKARSYF